MSGRCFASGGAAATPCGARLRVCPDTFFAGMAQMAEQPPCKQAVAGSSPAVPAGFRPFGFGRKDSPLRLRPTRGMAAWRRITAGNGGKGTFPMASRRISGFGPSRQARPSCPRWKAAGIAAQAMRGSSGFTHWFGLGRPGMQARERPCGDAPRDTHIANRQGQRVVHGSASLTSERPCAECRGSGGKPASCHSVE